MFGFMYTVSWISKVDFMISIKSINFQDNAKRWSIGLHSVNIEDIHHSTILHCKILCLNYNFPSYKLLAGLPHFLNNDFSYLASYVKFSKIWDPNHLCLNSPFIRSFLMLSWAFFMLHIFLSLCSTFIRN